MVTDLELKILFQFGPHVYNIIKELILVLFKQYNNGPKKHYIVKFSCIISSIKEQIDENGNEKLKYLLCRFENGAFLFFSF